MMNVNDVLIDLLEDNRRRLKRVFSALVDDCLFWKPETEANTIAITVWHMARMFDVFLTVNARGDLPEKEVWFRGGWVEQTGYNPLGTGQNGWGMLTGYTQEEADRVPRLAREQTLGYLDQVYDAVREFLAGISPQELFAPGAGFDGKFSQYQCMQMALMDNVRHLGEIYAIKAMWERRKERDGER